VGLFVPPSYPTTREGGGDPLHIFPASFAFMSVSVCLSLSVSVCVSVCLCVCVCRRILPHNPKGVGTPCTLYIIPASSAFVSVSLCPKRALSVPSAFTVALSASHSLSAFIVHPPAPPCPRKPQAGICLPPPPSSLPFYPFLALFSVCFVLALFRASDEKLCFLVFASFCGGK
jgi:hypothetical protein